MLDDAMKSAVSALSRALGRFRDLHPSVTALQIQFFLLVAENPGASQRRIYELLGTNDSVASRTFAMLSDLGSRNTPPMRLIEMDTNPEDRREKVVRLTPRGERLLIDIERDFGGK